MEIDPVAFGNFISCPYKAFLRHTGVVGEPTDFEIIQTELDTKLRREAIGRLLQENQGERISREPTSLAQAVHDSTKLILDVTVEALGVVLTCEVLERHDARSEGHQPLYVPVLFSHKNKVAREDSLLAALYGIVLSEALGQPTPFTKIIHGDGFSTSKVKIHGPSGPTRLAVETRQALERLRSQIESGTAPPMILNPHCQVCEHRGRCRAQAIERDDLSLLRGMSQKEILAQRKRGINTVTQFASTFRPKMVGKNKPPRRHLHALQALAVRDKKVYVVRTPGLPAQATRVYLDVEGVPDRDSYYLVGVIVEKDGECSAHSFWADEDAGERAIWYGLLDLLRGLGDFTLYHYGSYEKTYVTRMFKKYPSPHPPDPARLASASVNVLGLIRTNVYFPAYTNGLKDIASFVGATWGGRISSGIESIARRLRWEETRDELLKGEITEYNRDDCLAVQRVVHFLASLGSPQGPAMPVIVPASEIANDAPWRFGKINFVLPDMDLINKCARFDYQREKILLRTDPNVRASVRRKRAKKKPIRKANAEIRCGPPALCPACGSKKVIESVKCAYSKLVYDLKFTRTGVKRWVVRYVTGRNHCTQCTKTFNSDGYPTNEKSGHGLSSWAVYHHVALRQSFDDISLSINDIFGYCYSGKFGQRAQARLAESYRVTLDKMLDGLRSGRLIHTDETKVRARKTIIVTNEEGDAMMPG